MKRCTILFAAALCLAAGSARADDIWYGPGWYVIANRQGIILWSGPYESQDECELQMPPDNNPPGFIFSCSYFDLPPASQ